MVLLKPALWKGVVLQLILTTPVGTLVKVMTELFGVLVQEPVFSLVWKELAESKFPSLFPLLNAAEVVT